jgi:hypothetical protein
LFTLLLHKKHGSKEYYSMDMLEIEKLSNAFQEPTKGEILKPTKSTMFFTLRESRMVPPLRGSRDAASPLLARVRSTLVRLHPCRRGSAVSSTFATLGFSLSGLLGWSGSERDILLLRQHVGKEGAASGLISQ